jgi:hypothetical protein
MRGNTQYMRGFDGIRRKDLTFLYDVSYTAAGRIHQALCRKRARGEKVNNWWHYLDQEKFIIEWTPPLFK